MPKTIEELLAEKQAVERQIAQYQHRADRLENRERHLDKGERTKRTHRLVTRGAAIESVCELTKVLAEAEFYSLAEQIFSLPEIKKLVMAAVNDHNKNERMDS